MSGEHLQDHWSSGYNYPKMYLSFYTTVLRPKDGDGMSKQL